MEGQVVAEDQYKVVPALLSDAEDMFLLYQNTYREESSTALSERVLPVFGHLIECGTTYKATHGDQLIGFISSLQRGERKFISMLYVAADYAAGGFPEFRRSGIGSALCRSVFDNVDDAIFTLSSFDNRALGLYHRLGLQARGLLLELRAAPSVFHTLPATSHEVSVEHTHLWNDLVMMDRRAFGVDRSSDFVYWFERLNSVGVIVQRNGQTIGYSVVIWETDTDMWTPSAVSIGPIVANESHEFRTVLLEAAKFAGQRDRPLRLLLSADNDNIQFLLKLGFKVEGVEILCSSENCRLPDLVRYAPSNFITF